MGKLYDIRAVTGEYKDKDGNDKKRYATIGSVLETKNGKMLKIDLIPTKWDGWAYLNEPQDDREKPMTQSQALNGGKDVAVDNISDEPIDLSEIPF